MTELVDRKPGVSLIVKLKELQQDSMVISDESLSWFKGVKGELVVGGLLDSLKSEGFIVLHSVPIGEKDSDIDHVVVSPSGKVFTINTKNHAGKKVAVYEKSVLVDGTKTHYYRNSKFEAERVKKSIDAAYKVDSSVYPVLVFVNTDQVKLYNKPSDVKSLSSPNLLKWIRQVEKSEVSELFPVQDVLEYGFWTKKVQEPLPQDELFAWFATFTGNIAALQRRKNIAGAIVLVGILAAAFFGYQFLVNMM